jgi:hypothetical protein
MYLLCLTWMSKLMFDPEKSDIRDDSYLQNLSSSIWQPHSNSQITPHSLINSLSRPHSTFETPSISPLLEDRFFYMLYKLSILVFLSISPSDTMAEWSKAVDLSAAWISTTEMCVGSNPTRVNISGFAFFYCSFCFSNNVHMLERTVTCKNRTSSWLPVVLEILKCIFCVSFT